MHKHEARISKLAQVVREHLDSGRLGSHTDCEARGNEQEQRVQVRLASNALDQQRERKVTGVLLHFRFPYKEQPFEVLEGKGVNLPTSVRLGGLLGKWKPNKSGTLTLHVGLKHSEREIAEWIDQLLTQVLGADEDYELQVRYSWKEPLCDHLWPKPAPTQTNDN